jgi:hypothetical protein
MNFELKVYLVSLEHPALRLDPGSKSQQGSRVSRKAATRKRCCEKAPCGGATGTGTPVVTFDMCLTASDAMASPRSPANNCKMIGGGGGGGGAM